MSSIIRFPEANPIRIVLTQFEGTNFNNRDNKLFNKWSMPYNIETFAQPFLKADSLSFQFHSSFESNIVNVIRYRDGAVVIDDVLTDGADFEDGEEITFEDGEEMTFEGSGASINVVVKDNGTYKTREATIQLSELTANEKYYVRVSGVHTNGKTFSARSELIEVKTSFCNTILLEYYNFEPAFDIDYRSGVVFQIRLPAFFDDSANDNDFDNFINSIQTVTKVTDSTIRKRILQFYDLIPVWLAEKVNIILAHDYLTIEDLRVVSDKKMLVKTIGISKLWCQPDADLSIQTNDLINRHDSNARVLFA